jgi:hypothetical protein
LVRTVVVRATAPSGGGGAITGLDFPGSAAGGNVGPSPLLVWNAGLTGSVAPMARSPATYIWRALTREQPNDGYWVMIAWAPYSPDGNVDFTTTDKYVLFTPYIDQKWEIATSALDTPTNRALAPAVEFKWHTCVATVNGNVYTFWPDWDDNPSTVLTFTDTNAATPSNPSIQIGDASWHRRYEVMSGVLRGFQFYDAVLTAEQVDDEIAEPGSFRTPWYLNLNPTPDEDSIGVQDQSGNGNHPVWVPFPGQEPGIDDLPELWAA